MSVSRRPEKLAEAPSAIQVVTGEDIRRAGSTSLPEALRLAGNLHVARKGAHDWGISARGFNTDSANKLLVLMDGRAVYTPLFSGVFWDRQDYLLADIDRIEVISGPGGTLWGANAVNGVINVLSKNARDTQGAYLEAGAGTAWEHFAGARYGGEISPDVHYRIYGKQGRHEGAALSTGGQASDGWRMTQGGFRVDAGLKEGTTLTLQGDAYQQRSGLAAGGKSEVDGANLLGRLTRVFADGSDMQLQVYYDRTKLSLPVPAAIFAPAGTFRDELDTYDIDFQHNLAPSSRHHLIWGLGYRFTDDRVGNAPALTFLPPTLRQDLFSGFVQDEFTVTENVTLTAGTKVEHNDYTGLELEPSIRAQWNVSPTASLWTAVSRAIRAPSRVERDLYQPAPEYTIVVLQGSPRFDSEEVYAYEAGWRASLGSSAVWSASVFLHDYRNLRSTSISPPDPVFNLPFPFFYENNLEGRTYGVELSASWQVREGWRLHAAYNLLQEDIRVKPGHADFNNALNETADPEHQLSLRSSLDLPHGLELDVALRWVDSLDTNNVGVVSTVPSYGEMDVRLGWQGPHGIELSVVGQNLLHDRHLEYRRTNSPDVEIERSVHGKIAWRF